ncbi:cytochrome o ubiquinol oxidase subunit IV [Labrys sp. KB_33_2]|uniref:cytochrome o ubiquinol oxidase subunit IV n=1 Tax=Labrys sp. KB_33_2 TaxID=3237479 RepID=UPI003F9204A1
MKYPTEKPDVPLNAPHLHVPHLSDYLIGFVLATILTVGAFWAVSSKRLEPVEAISLIAIFAVVQMLAQVKFFLHWSSKRTPIEATIALIFAAFQASIMIGGGVWVMLDLHSRMMP